MSTDPYVADLVKMAQKGDRKALIQRLSIDMSYALFVANDSNWNPLTMTPKDLDEYLFYKFENIADVAIIFDMASGSSWRETILAPAMGMIQNIVTFYQEIVSMAQENRSAELIEALTTFMAENLDGVDVKDQYDLDRVLRGRLGAEVFSQIDTPYFADHARPESWDDIRTAIYINLLPFLAAKKAAEIDEDTPLEIPAWLAEFSGNLNDARKAVTGSLY